MEDKLDRLIAFCEERRPPKEHEKWLNPEYGEIVEILKELKEGQSCNG